MLMLVPGERFSTSRPSALQMPTASEPPGIDAHVSMPGTSGRTSPIMPRPVSRPE